MNNDDTNLNPNSNLQAWIEPELEARVVAWVAGEASAFETAELERLCAEKPELAIFKRRIEAVHGVVGEAIRPDPKPLRLGDNRREKLLATLRGAEPKERAPARTGRVVPFVQRLWSQRRARRWIMAAAACVPFAGVVLFLSVPEPQPQRPTPDMTVLGAQGENEVVRLDAFTLSNESKLRRRVTAAGERLKEAFTGREDKVMRPVALEEPRPVPQTTSIAMPAPEQSDIPQATQPSVTTTGPVPGQAPIHFGAAAPQAAPSTEMVPLKVEYPKPLFVGTPRPLPIAPTPPQEAPVQMSPFVVNDDRVNMGYSSMAIANQRVNSQALDLRESIKDQINTFGSTTTAGARQEAKTDVGADGAGSPGLLLGQQTLTHADAAKGDGSTLYADIRGERVPLASLQVTGALPPATTGSITLGAAATTTPANSQPAPSGGPLLTLPGMKADAAGTPVASPIVTVGGTFLGQTEARKDISSDFQAQLKATTPVARDEAKAKKTERDDPPPPARPAPVQPPIDEVSAAKDAISTFSLHVSDVSFRLAQTALARGEMPEAARIRPEEFYNAFDYADPLPALAEKVGCRIEQAAHPFVQQRNLVRIAMRVPAAGRSAAQPLRLTVLLDTSGSMEREDRAAAVRAAFKALLALLGPEDRITVIGFARTPRLLAEAVAGNQAAWLLDILDRTPAEGGTNMEEALKLGAQLARRHQLPTAQNRIILLTDGAANLGDANPERLARSIEALRRDRIAFDACGVVLDGLDDAVLEALTRKGDGRYYVLNSPEAADTGFARQIAGALRPAAENVKLQVRFNPARVGRYRLIGFDQHRLRTEDFRNDKVDAAELAAEEAAVALYQVEVLPEGSGELGEVSVRFRDAATGQMVENTWPISHDPQARAFDRASPSLQLAGTAAFLAEKIRGGSPADAIKLRDLAPVINSLRTQYPRQARVQELAAMYQTLRRLTGQ